MSDFPNETRAPTSNGPPTGLKKVPVPLAPTPDADDRAAARKEERELERAAKASEHQRDEVARKIIACGMWVLMVAVFVVIIAAVLTLGYHLLLPKGYHWLDPKELQDVKNAVLSGAVVGLGTTYLRRYVDER